MSKLTQMRQQAQAIARQQRAAIGAARAPAGPGQVVLGLNGETVLLGIQRGGAPPDMAGLTPEQAKEIGCGLIVASASAIAERQRLAAVREQAKAELADHPSNQEREPGEPSAAPHTPASSPGPSPIIVVGR